MRVRSDTMPAGAPAAEVLTAAEAVSKLVCCRGKDGLVCERAGTHATPAGADSILVTH